jgi:hypothetical protein
MEVDTKPRGSIFWSVDRVSWFSHAGCVHRQYIQIDGYEGLQVFHQTMLRIVRKRLCWNAIANIRCTCECFGPECCRKIRLEKHRADHIHKRSV